MIKTKKKRPFILLIDLRVKKCCFHSLLKTDNRRVCHIPNTCTWYNQQYHKLVEGNTFAFLLPFILIVFFTFFISLFKKNRIAHSIQLQYFNDERKKNHVCRKKFTIYSWRKKKRILGYGLFIADCRQYRCHFYGIRNSEFLTNLRAKEKCQQESPRNVSGSWH